MTSRYQRLALLGLAAPLLAAGCGAGVAGVAASSGSGSSGSSAPSIVNLSLNEAKRSPARIAFELQNAAASVELRYRADPAGAFTPMKHLIGLAANPASFAPGSHAFDWDFQAEAGIDPSGRLEREAEIEVAVVGLAAGQRAGVGVGNDLPRITSTAADVDPVVGEASGIVLIEATLEDTPDDRADLRVEFSLDGTSWQLARPAQFDATPEFAFTDVVVAAAGSTTVAFFWDTFDDLGDADADAFIRFVPFESVEGTLEQGTMLASGSFRVDNNLAPVVQLDSGLLLITADERRGIPISCRVFDEEGDRVELILQWRRRGEAFPPLPEDNAGLDAILADATLRAAHQVCTPYPLFARGRVVPVDGSSLRLPELAGGESWILASGLEGRTLELLRPSSLPEPIEWTPNPLVSPIAALPVGDGLTAIVLQENGRLLEIALATGTVVREIATLPGSPSLMTLERGEKAVLVALDDAGTWRIERVELASGVITEPELIVSDGTEPAPVRGIASLGTGVAVFTAGSSLFSLDYRDPLAVQLGRLLTDLATPWGVVLDPLNEGQLYLAECDCPTSTGTGRILAIDLDSHAMSPVVVELATLLDLERPEALALQRRGNRLLAVTSVPGSGRQLVGVDLGGREGNAPFALGGAIDSGVASMSSGPEGLLILAPSGEDELLVGGGLEQRRVIEAFDPRQRLAVLATPLEPPARPGQHWRIPYGTRTKVSPGGQAATFVWDSADARGGEVFLRALPRDDEPGSEAVGAAPETSRASLDVDPLELGDSSSMTDPSSVATADFDGDGLEDIVAANKAGNNLTIFLQERGGFAPTPPIVLGGPATTKTPVFVAAADLDEDGDLDLVSASQGRRTAPLGREGSLTVFLHGPGGDFAPNPVSVYPTVLGPSSAAAADLDGDGHVDIASANEDGDNLTVFFRESGGFAAPPLVLGTAETTNAPASIAAADLDGDGDLDLVSANKGTSAFGVGSSLTVFFQDSRGDFDPTNPLELEAFPVKRGASSVTAADLDGDGDLDIASANTISNDLTIFSQEAPASFAPIPLVLDTFRPRALVAADLDGDGDLDLSSANEVRPYLTAFYQEAPGSFDPAPLALEPDSIQIRKAVSIAADDLDGDGDMDLVAANEVSDDLTVFLQSSSGRPLEPAETRTLTDISFATAADLDADGDIDLVAARSPNFTTLSIFFQELGSFPQDPVPLSISASPDTVAAADLDGDGRLDLVGANFLSDNLTVSLQLQESPGTFDDSPLVLGEGITIGARSVAAADLDGDGDLDLISANQGNTGVPPQGFGGGLSAFLNGSRGGFDATPVEIVAFPTVLGPSCVMAADLDGDGNLDIASANDFGDDLTVFLQLSGTPLTFASPLVLGNPGITGGASFVAAADLDGDGDLDLVSANERSSNLTVFFQTVFFQQAGGYPEIPQVALGGNKTTGNPLSVAAVDFDGDGDMDLASANNGSDSLTVFFQEAPGRFTASPLNLPVPAPVHVATADLDGDGDQDLISSVDGGLTIFWGGR